MQVLHTVPWVLCAGTTMRTPAGSDVTVTGDLPAWLAGRTVTIEVPALECGAATFRMAEEHKTSKGGAGLIRSRRPKTILWGAGREGGTYRGHGPWRQPRGCLAWSSWVKPPEARAWCRWAGGSVRRERRRPAQDSWGSYWAETAWAWGSATWQPRQLGCRTSAAAAGRCRPWTRGPSSPPGSWC